LELVPVREDRLREAGKKYVTVCVALVNVFEIVMVKLFYVQTVDVV